MFRTDIIYGVIVGEVCIEEEESHWRKYREKYDWNADKRGYIILSNMEMIKEEETNDPEFFQLPLQR